jgi:hypothetical protein
VKLSRESSGLPLLTFRGKSVSPISEIDPHRSAACCNVSSRRTVRVIIRVDCVGMTKRRLRQPRVKCTRCSSRKKTERERERKGSLRERRSFDGVSRISRENRENMQKRAIMLNSVGDYFGRVGPAMERIIRAAEQLVREERGDGAKGEGITGG